MRRLLSCALLISGLIGSKPSAAQDANGWGTDLVLQRELSNYGNHCSEGGNTAFGSSIAISGDVVAAGAPFNDFRYYLPTQGDPSYRMIYDKGGVVLFQRTEGLWRDTGCVMAPDLKEGDEFGTAVAIDETTVVAGAPGREVDGVPGTGAVFLFDVLASRPELEGIFPRASDGVVRFGQAVALQGDRLLVGAPESAANAEEKAGIVFFYSSNSGSWTEQQRITASDTGAEDLFGSSLALDGQTLAVGSTRGVAVFELEAGQWLERQKLTPPGTMPFASFGYSAAVSGDTIVVGGDGSAHVYTGIGGVWSEQQELVSADAPDWSGYGRGVFVSGDTAIVAQAVVANEDEASPFAAYRFSRSNGSWTMEQTLPTPGKYASLSLLRQYSPTALAGNGGTAVLGYDMQAWDSLLAVFAPPVSDGSRCAVDSVCTSGFCERGMCCATECEGGCVSCRKDQGAEIDGICRILPQGTMCRGAVSECDLEEVCDGSERVCPPDLLASDGTACDDANADTENDTCQQGACTGDPIAGSCASPIPLSIPADLVDSTEGMPVVANVHYRNCGAEPPVAPGRVYAIRYSAGRVVEVVAEPDSGFDVSIRALLVCEELAACIGYRNQEGPGVVEIFSHQFASRTTIYVVIEGVRPGSTGSFRLTVFEAEVGDPDSLDAGAGSFPFAGSGGSAAVLDPDSLDAGSFPSAGSGGFASASDAPFRHDAPPTGDQGEGEGKGCSCSVPGPAFSTSHYGVLFLIAIVLLLRRVFSFCGRLAAPPLFQADREMR